MIGLIGRCSTPAPNAFPFPQRVITCVGVQVVYVRRFLLVVSFLISVVTPLSIVWHFLVHKSCDVACTFTYGILALYEMPVVVRDGFAETVTF